MNLAFGLILLLTAIFVEVSVGVDDTSAVVGGGGVKLGAGTAVETLPHVYVRGCG